MHIAIPAMYLGIAVVGFILTVAMFFAILSRLERPPLTPTRGHQARSATRRSSSAGEPD